MLKNKLLFSCASGLVLMWCLAGGERPGSTALAGPVAALNAVPLHRFVELHGSFYHFYTADQKEAEGLKKNAGWKYEGIIGYVFPKKVNDTVPLYRLLKSEFGGTNHFYTVDMNEANNAIQGGWIAEGIAGYVSKDKVAGTKALHRLYKPCYGAPNDGKFRDICEDATGGDAHFYTTDEKELASATQGGYQLIRVEAYVWETAASSEVTAAAPTGKAETNPYAEKINYGYARGFGRQPTTAEFNYWVGQLKANNYDTDAMVKLHGGWLKTPAASKERTEMTFRVYFEVFGRPTTPAELNYWRDKIVAEGTTYEQMRTANVQWLGGSSPQQVQERRDTIKRAFIAAGKPEPTEAQYQNWTQQIQFLKFHYKTIVATLKK